MRTPSMGSLPSAVARAARFAAERLKLGGHRAWIVGGAVRDLALGLEPGDVDLASAATPAEVEALFERSIPIGRAFGTLEIPLDGLALQHTTFRSESVYRDGRRPEEVRFGTTLAEDAQRRDFTCNALYLDPLTDELQDPSGGLADLERCVLRTVGDPRERFREDRLRMVRMARFAAAFELQIDPATWFAARAQAADLAGVSPERGLKELERIFSRPGSARAFELLCASGLREPLLPGQTALLPPGLSLAEADRLRTAALAALAPPPGLVLGLAVLLDPEPAEPGRSPFDLSASLVVLQGLRTSRETQRGVSELMDLRREIESAGAGGSRARRLRLVRGPRFAEAARLVRAWRTATDSGSVDVAGLETLLSNSSPAELWPKPLLQAADLAAAGVPRGPRWGELLVEVETEELEGRLTSRDAALAWLDQRLRG